MSKKTRLIALVAIWWICGATGWISYMGMHGDVRLWDAVCSAPALGFTGPIAWLIVWQESERIHIPNPVILQARPK